jgi:uncharacterized repeat protein (TIGR01451 family)
MGNDLGLSGDGTVLLSRASDSPTLDPVWAYQYVSGSWVGPTWIASVADAGFNHHSLALSQDGTHAVIGSPGGVTGTAYVLTRSGTSWSSPVALSQIGQGSNQSLGFSTAMTQDGKTAFVGAVGTNPVFVYESPVAMGFSVTSSHSSGLVPPGTQITFQFTVLNMDADIDATNVVLDEVLPVGASYVSSNAGSGACSYSSASHSVSCTLASLPVGSAAWSPSVTITLATQVGSQFNTAGISADQPLDGATLLKTSFYADAPPVAEDGSVKAVSGKTVSGQAVVKATSTGQTLSFYVKRSPAHGTVLLSASTGGFTYTSAAGYTGTDSFEFYASDGHVTSNAANISVQISGGDVGSTSASGGGFFNLLSLVSLLSIAVWRRRMLAVYANNQR